MEDQVTSLEMSKQLKEAGFEVDTPFAWMISVSGKDMVDAPITKRGHQLPCYTFQPLWKALLSIDFGGDLFFSLNEDNIFLSDDYLMDMKTWKMNSLPDTAGESVIWGIKEGYIKLDKKK